MDLEHDDRVRSALETPGPFRRLRHHHRVGSTNDLALDALLDGEPPGLVVVADRQSRGRGRAGGVWTDDVDGACGPASMAVTATLSSPPGPLGLVPLAVGLAVLDVFEHLGAAGALKWPNDVLLRDRKAAGILVERHQVARGDVLLVGCGLDLDWRGVARSAASEHWTSLAEVTGRAVDRAQVLAALLQALPPRLDDVGRDPSWLRHDYTRRCTTIGARIRATLPGGRTLRGEAAGIDEDGRLQVRVGTSTVPLSAGEVTHLRPGPDDGRPGPPLVP